MQSVMVDYDETNDVITAKDAATEETWVSVCRRFNDDVHRLRNVSGMGKFTGLYECFDDDNKRTCYIVEEDEGLYRLRHKHFLEKIGQ